MFIVSSLDLLGNRGSFSNGSMLNNAQTLIDGEVLICVLFRDRVLHKGWIAFKGLIDTFMILDIDLGQKSFNPLTLKKGK